MNACIQEVDAVDAESITPTKVTRETGMLHRHQMPIPILQGGGKLQFFIHQWQVSYHLLN